MTAPAQTPSLAAQYAAQLNEWAKDVNDDAPTFSGDCRAIAEHLISQQAHIDVILTDHANAITATMQMMTREHELSELLAKLESECFEGYPSGTRGVFDYVAELKQERDDLKKQVTHWKANHKDQVDRSRFISDRPDLPVERTRAYKRMEQLQAERDALMAKLGHPDNQIQSVPAMRDAMFFIGKDGDEFYAVRDDFKSLQESEATFGKTPVEALCGLLNVPQPAKPLTEDFLTRLDRWLCRAKFEGAYDVERCVEFGKEIHKMLAQVTQTKPTDDLLEVVRGLCCMVDQINAMPDDRRENFPSPLSDNSPLMIAARQACLDHGFTEGGLAISAEQVAP